MLLLQRGKSNKRRKLNSFHKLICPCYRVVHRMSGLLDGLNICLPKGVYLNIYAKSDMAPIIS